MMRPEWGILSFLTCAAVALAVLLPFLPYLIAVFTNGAVNSFIDIYTATAISGVIAIVMSVIFYKIAVGNAKELLSKAEV
jgi:hypothetical protein